MHGPYGAALKFFVTFEVDLDRDDPPEGYCTRHVVRSEPFALSVSAKSNFRKFLNRWFPRALTDEECTDFDTEDLIGRPAQLTVGHEEGKEDRVYARILVCQPYKGNDPLEPSGTYTREKDRQDDDGRGGRAAAGKPGKAAFKSTSGAGPAKSDKVPTPAEIAKDPGKVRVHLGKLKDQELRDLSREDIELLIERFLERDFPKLSKPTAADVRLKLALEAYKKKFAREDAAAESGEADEGGPADPTDY